MQFIKQFIKKNLFSIILVVVLGGGSAGIFLLSKAPKADVEKAAKKRQSLSKKLSRFKDTQLNNRVLAVARREAEQSKKAAEDLQQEGLNWNRKNFEVMTLSVRRAGKAVEFDAFPIDKDRYRDEVLGMDYTRQYLSEMRSLLSTLKPTEVPSEQEVQNRVLQWETILQREPGDDEGYDSSEAREKGLMSAIVARARQGYIYAAEDSMDFVFDTATRRPDVAKLWQGQVGLWVQKEIVEAIKATNAQKFELVDPANRNVLTAAVKRLVKISVQDRYIIASKGVAPPTSFSPRGRRSYAPRGRGGSFEGGRNPFTGALSHSGGLTGRGTDTTRDVVYYSFRVVMPLRYLMDLERNLLARNYHTIMRVSWTEVTEGPETGFYYGQDTPVEVTIDGELVLLTDWVRDLMPDEALATRFAYNQQALRPQDSKRLEDFEAVGAGPRGAKPPRSSRRRRR